MRKRTPLENFKNIFRGEDNNFVSRLDGTATISNEIAKENGESGEVWSGSENTPANPLP